MSLDVLVMGTVGFSCTLLLFRSWTVRPRLWGWFGVSLFVLGVLALALVLAPTHAGTVSAALWVPMVLLPLVCRSTAQRALYRRRYRLAARAGRLMGWLHPMDHWPEIATLYRGLAQAQAGAFATAERTFRSVSDDPVAGWQARLYILAIADRWDAIAAMATQLPPAGQGIVLRAYGETRDLDAFMAHFTTLQGGSPDRPADLRMLLAAFTGRPDIVRTLQSTALSGAAPESNQLHLATAEQAAGHTTTAASILQALTYSTDAIIARTAARRLNAPLEPVPIDFEETLPTDAANALIDAWTTVHREDRLSTIARPRKRVVPVTTMLVLALCGWFLAQALHGGVDDTRTLMALGAMKSPLSYLGGEYWRIATAGWLHFGWGHFGVNLVGLWLFGRFIETALGKWRMLAIYLFSGVAAMATWLWLTYDAPEPQAVIGASASIMGLVGAAAVVLIRRRRAKVGGRRNQRELGLLILMVSLQIVFDMAIPQSSFVGHATGFAWGVAATLVVARGSKPKPRPEAVAR